MIARSPIRHNDCQFEPAAAVRTAPFISVVMPVRNEQACLGKLLGQMLSQDYPADRFEVLVVDGRSTDRTRDVVEDLMVDHKNLRLLDNPWIWSSAARNVGVREANGEIVLIVDGHCELSGKDYLRHVAAAFEDPSIDCLGRPQPLEAPSPTSLEQSIGLARASRLGHHPASYIYSSEKLVVPAHSVAVAYRRSLFERVGLFDESFDACEDVELNCRVDQAGGKCLLVPQLAVSYRPRTTLKGLFRQLQRYGQGRMRLLRKHPSTFSLVGFLPAMALAGALIGWIGAFVWVWWLLAYALAAMSYFAIVGKTSLALAVKVKKPKLFFTLCAVFFTVHFAFAWGILYEFVRGLRRSHWANPHST